MLVRGTSRCLTIARHLHRVKQQEPLDGKTSSHFTDIVENCIRLTKTHFLDDQKLTGSYLGEVFNNLGISCVRDLNIEFGHDPVASIFGSVNSRIWRAQTVRNRAELNKHTFDIYVSENN